LIKGFFRKKDGVFRASHRGTGGTRPITLSGQPPTPHLLSDWFVPLFTNKSGSVLIGRADNNGRMGRVEFI